MPHESTQGLGLIFKDFGPNLSQSRRQMICSRSLLAVPIFFNSWPLGLPSASTLLAMLYVPIRPCSFNLPSSQQAVLDGTVIRNTTRTPAHRSREHKQDDEWVPAVQRGKNRIKIPFYRPHLVTSGSQRNASVCLYLSLPALQKHNLGGRNDGSNFTVN